MGNPCKKVSFLGMVMLLWAINLSAQGPDTLWTRTYGGTGDDRGYSVQQTSDGGYIIAGHTSSFGAGGYDVYLIKTDAHGDTLWTKVYGGVYDDIGRSVQETFDSGYIVTGGTRSFGRGEEDVYLIKTDADGDTLWTKTHGGRDNDAGYSIQQTSDGGYIIAGYTGSSSAGGSDVYLIKTSVNGDAIWTRTYGGTWDDVGYSVQQTSDGGYIIVGTPGVYLIKTDAQGDTLWTRTYSGIEQGYSVQQTSDGGYIIAGWTLVGEYNPDVYLIKTDANGDILWTRTYGGTEGYSVQQTSDGGYIITGFTYSGVGAKDVYLIKTDANGDTLWTGTYGKGFGYSVQETSDSVYIIVGYTFGAYEDVYLIKTKPLIKLTSPTGGEVLVSNTIHHITWVPAGTNYDSYRLLYSLDGGESYPYIIADRISPNSGLYSWRVPKIDCNTCRVKVQIINMKGRVMEEDESDSNFTIQSTGIEEGESLPKSFFVSSIESPQADRALIKYELPRSSNIHIVIYNLLGQEIKTLVSKKQNAGIYTILWDGRDNTDKKLSSGVYFLRFEACPVRSLVSYGAGRYKAIRKLLIMR